MDEANRRAAYRAAYRTAYRAAYRAEQQREIEQEAGDAAALRYRRSLAASKAAATRKRNKDNA